MPRRNRRPNPPAPAVFTKLQQQLRESWLVQTHQATFVDIRAAKKQKRDPLDVARERMAAKAAEKRKARVSADDARALLAAYIK